MVSVRSLTSRRSSLSKVVTGRALVRSTGSPMRRMERTLTLPSLRSRRPRPSERASRLRPRQGALTTPELSGNPDSVSFEFPPGVDEADPFVRLRAVVALRRLADRVEATGVLAARERGWSWQQIGDALGV